MINRHVFQPAVTRLRQLREESERGSLPMLMLVITVGLSLASLLIPVVLSQSQGTRNTMTKVRSLHAAEAGTDIALGAIRAANNGATTGDTTKLPCGPLAGTLNSTAGTTYRVTLDYYVNDPTGQSASWLSSNKMHCATGYGTYDPASAGSVPKDAILTSVGTSTIGNLSSTRTLVSTYVFQTSTATTNGGVIRIYPSSTSTTPMCMDVGSSWGVGTPVVLQPCSTSTPPSVQQTFSYNTDLSIQLVGSTATVSPNGLCLDSAIPRAVGNPVVLRNCYAAGFAPYNQQWSINDVSAIEGARSDRTLDSQSCMNVAAQTAGTPVLLQATCGSSYDTTTTWVPSPTVGAGAAGTSYNQLVNLQQFGRCLDVTNQTFSSTFLISYPCKQNPTPTAVAFNQRFTYSTLLHTLSTTDNSGVTECMTNPATAGSYITFSLCSGQSNQQWLSHGSVAQDTSTATSDWGYDKRYAISDMSYNLCVSLGPTTDLYQGQYSK
ncbi:MAG TPA: ricin-type beta-trefoil lectin domain protein, partial [Jatrophihabitans sp.]|nr:ricin-type beta-trefoil lectin domain protein [Jatrophihabitans sp.]